MLTYAPVAASGKRGQPIAAGTPRVLGAGGVPEVVGRGVSYVRRVANYPGSSLNITNDAGNLLVVIFQTGSSGGGDNNDITTISDSNGNRYNRLKYVTSDKTALNVFFTNNIKGGSNTVSLYCPASNNDDPGCYAIEFSGASRSKNPVRVETIVPKTGGNDKFEVPVKNNGIVLFFAGCEGNGTIISSGDSRFTEILANNSHHMSLHIASTDVLYEGIFSNRFIYGGDTSVVFGAISINP